MKPIINISTADNSTELRPGSFFQKERFQDFLSVCYELDACFNAEKKCQSTRVAYEQVVAFLKEEGYEVRLVEGPEAPRPPQGSQEEWAAMALLQLESDDPDVASQKNHVGFNKTDSQLGHSLALQLHNKGGKLSPKQWALAVKLCKKYWRQVGKCPT